MAFLPALVRRVTWLELFFDLAFVAAVAQVAAPLAEDFSLHGLARFTLLFLLIWWAWLGQTLFSTRFGAGDARERAATFLQICAATAMAVNSQGALDSRDAAGLAAAYAVMRLLLGAQYSLVVRDRRAQPLARRYQIGCVVSGGLWLTSALTPPPARFALWAAAFAADAATPIVAERHGMPVPPHSEHLPERFGLFTIILLGESMAAVMRGMRAHETWPPAAALSVLAGLAAVYYVWWQYFHGIGAAAPRHVRSRRAVAQLLAWAYTHVPFYVGVALTGIGFEHLIVSASPLPDAAIAAKTSGALLLVVTSLAALRQAMEVSPSHTLRMPAEPAARTWPAPLSPPVVAARSTPSGGASAPPR